MTSTTKPTVIVSGRSISCCMNVGAVRKSFMSKPISYAASSLEEALKAKGLNVVPFESTNMAAIHGDISRTTIHAIAQAVVFTFLQDKKDEGVDAIMSDVLDELLKEVKE